MADQQNAPQDGPMYSIEKLYVKGISVEVPNAPQIFLERTAPQVDVQLHHASTQIEADIYHTVLSITVTAKVGDKTMFLVEAEQAGIFIIKNVPQSDMETVLGIANPNILYPYAREVISDAVTRAGFPAVVLNPVNFEALFQAQKQAAQQQAQPQIITTTH